MITNISKKKKILVTILILFFLLLNISNLIYLSSTKSNLSLKNSEKLNLSRQETVQKSWLKNSDFNTTQYWNLIELGDTSDVSGEIDQAMANIEIIGDSGELQIDEPLNQSDWTTVNNPNLPILPDTTVINSSGCYVTHLWHENVNQTRNRPSVHWKRTINMPVDMRDYIITSASLEVIFNATVTVSPHALPTGGEGIDRFGDANLDDYSTGDYAEFYALLSDVNETIPPLQVAYNNTGELGRDSPALSNYSDTPMDIVPENVLISILTSVLSVDGYNFTITLGIDIYCEDNEIGVDVDRWNSLIIRNFNLTFTYEKKINQFTSGEWNQIGNMVNGSNVNIADANLKFKYKIDQTWPYLSSPNSEIKIVLNNNSLRETIKLRTAPTNFQEAKQEGFDVTTLISKDVNISLSIQVYLADQFALDHNITISIDDVILELVLVFIYTDDVSEPWLFTALLVIAGIAILSIASYLIAYYRVLKYPIPVRKVRKYQRSLKMKNEPQLLIIPQGESFDRAYNREVGKISKSLKVKTEEPEAKTLKPTKFKEKSTEPKMTTDELINESIKKKSELDDLIEKLKKN